MRKPIIAGNWKMNMDYNETEEFIRNLLSEDLDPRVEAVLCPPTINLDIASDLVKDSEIKIGAQNMFYEDSGAFTGETSPTMLKAIGIDYVILGHSERREYFCESDEAVNKKIMAAFNNNIRPIFCVGETFDERKEGRDRGVIKFQISKGVNGLNQDQIKNLVVAYEPVWAIGTGSTASAEDANSMVSYIRDLLREMYGSCAEETRILYGGSVNPGNIRDFMDQSDIDGALVGGASLKFDSFRDLVNFKK